MRHPGGQGFGFIFMVGTQGGSLLDVTFFGVRGSTPTACEQTRRYGGNTACVALQVADEPPLLLDLGTGLRFFGETQPEDGSFRGAALVSHLHWDHVQGLPFFVPILRPGASFDIYAPSQEDGRSVAEAFDAFMRAPYFPVGIAQLPGEIRFHDLDEGPVKIGAALVTALSIPHVGRTFGYRIEWAGASVAYLPDHQQPADGGFDVSEAALELADGVDLLIHDAQYTVPEFAKKSNWGHCTYEYAMWVAKRGRVGSVALFHHDPIRSDDALDEVLRCCEQFADRTGVVVTAASEGQRISLGAA
jgi:phosphoribosyl 1,2-cyclic phosphodiesterase